MNGIKTFTISSQPYYDQMNQCYKNILTINAFPEGPLRSIVRQIKFPKLSPFKQYSQCCPIPSCGLVLYSLDTCDCDHLMTPEEIPNLIYYLTANGYQLETQFTNMLQHMDIKSDHKKWGFVATYYGSTSPNVTYMR
jgi:hypothetical protein